MTKKVVKPYGSWKSPITSDLIVAGTIGLGEITLTERIFIGLKAAHPKAGEAL
jgi:hypothetical protein